MSSPSDRPYKSRFFNFLNRYSIRIRDQAGVAWRNAAQTSIAWGTQILIYPVYLVVQAGRFAQGQLKQAVRDVPKLLASRLKKKKSQPIALQPPTERVLQAIQTNVTQQGIPRLEIHLLNSKRLFSELHQPSALAIPEKTDSSLVAEPFRIQGIVSLLDSHRLAVVSSENVVLDILTQEQQEALNERIRLEIANYWYERRLQQKLQRKVPGLMPSFRRTWSNVLPPIRWFWQIMRWEQTSAVAKEINLFGETSLVPVEALPSELTPPPLLSRLDEKISLIEEQDLVSLTQWLQQKLSQSSGDLSKSPAWRIEVLIRAAVDYFFGDLESQKVPTFNKEQPILTGDEQPLALPIQESLGQKLIASAKETGAQWLYTVSDRIYDRLPDTTINPESDPFKIQVLLRATLEYFLEQEKFRHLELPEIPEVLPASPQVSEADPWLSWRDLFNPTTTSQSVFEASTSEIASLPVASSIPPQLNHPQQPGIKQEATPIISKNTRTKIPQTTSQKVVSQPVTVTPQTVAAKSVPDSAIVNQSFPTSYDSRSDQDWPDWVEIKATPTGYEKHFLERILGWLDQIILWIEEIMIKIWNWFKSKKHSRKRGHR